jgi:hypothetical protein
MIRGYVAPYSNFPLAQNMNKENPSMTPELINSAIRFAIPKPPSSRKTALHL